MIPLTVVLSAIVLCASQVTDSNSVVLNEIKLWSSNDDTPVFIELARTNPSCSWRDYQIVLFDASTQDVYNTIQLDSEEFKHSEYYIIYLDSNQLLCGTCSGAVGVYRSQISGMAEIPVRKDGDWITFRSGLIDGLVYMFSESDQNADRLTTLLGVDSFIVNKQTMALSRCDKEFVENIPTINDENVCSFDINAKADETYYLDEEEEDDDSAFVINSNKNFKASKTSTTTAQSKKHTLNSTTKRRRSKTSIMPARKVTRSTMFRLASTMHKRRPSSEGVPPLTTSKTMQLSSSISTTTKPRTKHRTVSPTSRITSHKIKHTIALITSGTKKPRTNTKTTASITSGKPKPWTKHATELITNSTKTPRTKHTTKQITSGTTKPMRKHTTQITSGSTKPRTKHTTTQITSGTTEPRTKHTTTQITSGTTKPRTKHTATAITSGKTKPWTKHSTTPITSGTTKSRKKHNTTITTSRATKPLSKYTATPITSHKTKPWTKHTTTLITSRKTKPSIKHTTTPITSRKTKPWTKHTTTPITSRKTKLWTKHSKTPITSHKTKPWTKHTTASITNSTTQSSHSTLSTILSSRSSHSIAPSKSAASSSGSTHLTGSTFSSTRTSTSVSPLSSRRTSTPVSPLSPRRTSTPVSPLSSTRTSTSVSPLSSRRTSTPVSPLSSRRTSIPVSPTSSRRTASTPVSPTSSSRTASTPVSSQKTSSSSSSSASRTIGSTINISPTPSAVQVVINEANLVIERDINKYYVELKGLPGANLKCLSVVVFDAVTDATLLHLRLDANHTLDANGLHVIGINLKVTPEAVAVTLYDHDKWENSYSDHVSVNALGLLDVIIVGKDRNRIKQDLKEIMIPGYQSRVIVVDTRNFKSGKRYTLSRCHKNHGHPDPGQFLVTKTTIGLPNNCSTGYGTQVEFKLKDALCHDFSRVDLQNMLVDVLVQKVADVCKCGLTQLSFKQRKFMCGSLILQTNIESSLTIPSLSGAIFQSFKKFVEDSNTLIVDGRNYHTDKCYLKCHKAVVPHGKPGGDNDQVNITVAVVVSCIAVFLLIVLLLILYMRRRQRAIEHFKLNRLDESDAGILHTDEDDIEQEPTFKQITLG